MAKNTLFWDIKKDIERLAEALRLGTVSLGSSDTVLGLMALATKEGYLGLNAIKERAEKPYIVLAKDVGTVACFAALPESEQIRQVLHAFWPGPLTVIFKKKEGQLAFVEGASGTVAFRVPAHEGLQQLLVHVGTIFSTSANKAGKPVPRSFADVHPEIVAAVEYVIEDRVAHETVTPSTIIDCSGGDVVLIREGAIPFSEIQNKISK